MSLLEIKTTCVRCSLRRNVFVVRTTPAHERRQIREAYVCSNCKTHAEFVDAFKAHQAAPDAAPAFTAARRAYHAAKDAGFLPGFVDPAAPLPARTNLDATNKAGERWTGEKETEGGKTWWHYENADGREYASLEVPAYRIRMDSAALVTVNGKPTLCPINA